MPRLETIFFDAGNTLFDLREKGETPELVRGKIYATVMRRYGGRVTDEEMTRFMTETVRNMPRNGEEAGYRYSVRWFRFFISRIIDRVPGVQHRRAVIQELFTYFRDVRNFHVFDDVVPALEMLRRRGVRAAIISNWSPTLTLVLSGLGILPCFTNVVISACVRMEKPDKEIFEYALRISGAKPETSAHVGDSLRHDFLGARDAGLVPVLLDRTGAHEPVETGFRLRSLGELEQVLDDA